jgi:hypothetical protein
MPTIRQEMIALLCQGEHGARDLSQILGVREKEVYAHLSHVERSVASQKQSLVIIAPTCHSCGYVFDRRKRFTRPSRCPRCRQERIHGPRYRIVQETLKSHG